MLGTLIIVAADAPGAASAGRGRAKNTSLAVSEFSEDGRTSTSLVARRSAAAVVVLSGDLGGDLGGGHPIVEAVRALSALFDLLLGVASLLRALRIIVVMSAEMHSDGTLDILNAIQDDILIGERLLRSGDIDALAAAGYSLAPRAGPEDRARWASARGSGVALWGERPRKGHSEGTKMATAHAHKQYILCGTRGCGGLVGVPAARRLARAATHVRIMPGDGCASAVCSVHHAPARNDERQQTRAHAVLAGDGEIVLAPMNTCARVQLHVLPHAIAARVAQAVLERGGKCAADASARMHLHASAAGPKPGAASACGYTLGGPVEGAMAGTAALGLRGGGASDDEASGADACMASGGTSGGLSDCDEEEDEAMDGGGATQAVDDFTFEDPSPRLVPVINGEPCEEESIELPEEKGAVFTIGRDASSGLELRDDLRAAGNFLVHGKHAQIVAGADGGYELRLVRPASLKGCSQATFVNEVGLRHVNVGSVQHTQPPVALADADTLRFGGHFDGEKDGGYDKFMYLFRAPDAAQPDRDTAPLVAAPIPPRKKKLQPILPAAVVPATVIPPTPVVNGGTATVEAAVEVTDPAAVAAAVVGAATAAAEAVNASVAAGVTGAPPAAGTPPTDTPRLISRTPGHASLELLTQPKARTGLSAGVAFIVSTKVGGFDLQAIGEGVSHSRGGAQGSWTALKEGQQRALTDGHLISIVASGATVEYECRLPPERPSAAAAAASSGGAAAIDGGSATTPVDTAAFAEAAMKQAQQRADLTAHLSGKQRSAALRSVSALNEAAVGILLGTATGADPAHAARVGANLLKKVAADGDKKRRRDEKAQGSAAAKAQRRDEHAAPSHVGRAPGGKKPPKRDRLDKHQNKLEARKARRQQEEWQRQQQQQQQRQQPPPPPPGGGRFVFVDAGGKGGGGKGGGGKGGGGKGGGGKGGGGKGGGKGAGKGGGKGGGGKGGGGKGGKGGGGKGGGKGGGYY